MWPYVDPRLPILTGDNATDIQALWTAIYALERDRFKKYQQAGDTLLKDICSLILGTDIASGVGAVAETKITGWTQEKLTNFTGSADVFTYSGNPGTFVVRLDAAWTGNVPGEVVIIGYKINAGTTSQIWGAQLEIGSTTPRTLDPVQFTITLSTNDTIQFNYAKPAVVGTCTLRADYTRVSLLRVI